MPLGSWTIRRVSAAAVAAILLFSLAAGLRAATGPAHLVADLDPGVAAFDPAALPRLASYTAVAGRVVFFSFLPEGDPDLRLTQCALWETGGTGVERLADLCGGSPGLDPDFLQLRVLATTGAVAFFTDPTGALWRTAGTAAGTFPLGGGAIVAPPNNGIAPTDSVLGPDGKTLFYAACTPEEGCEPWVSDGTRAGTRPIPLAPGPDGSDPAAFKVGGGRVLFTTGDTLWSSDGTIAGTRKLLEAAGPIQEDFLPLGNALYFIFNAGGVDTVSVLDLRSGVATNLGTFPAAALHLTTGVGLHAAGGRVLLTVYSPGSSAGPGAPESPGMVRLWETDGTPAGTHRIVPAVPFTSGGDAFFGVGPGGRTVVFAAGQGEDSQYREQLWALDPGSRRPRLLRNLPHPTFDLVEAAVFKGRLFLSGQDAQGYAPWMTDGTPAGTRLLKRLDPSPLGGVPAQFRVFGGSLIFTTTQKGEVWRTDGTPAGTVRLAAGGTAGQPYLPLDAAPLGLRLVFSGLDPTGGLEPFVSDLTPPGTRPIAKIGNSLAASSRPSGLATLGAKVLFASCKGATGALRVSDGTRAGTFPLPGSTAPCSPNPPPVRFEAAGGFAFAFWKNALWRTDGTRAGTRVLAAGPFLDGAPLGDRFLFLRDPTPTPPNDFEAVFGLADGSPQGLAGSFTVRFGFRPDGPLAGLGNQAFFVAPLPDFPFPSAFWRTDGTAAGTFPLLGNVQPLVGSAPEVASLNGRTYFIAAGRSEFGPEIWSTDGTAAGTAPVLPFPFFAFPFDLVPLHDRLLFFARSVPPSAPIFSLFYSDGTLEGTHFLHNFLLTTAAEGQSFAVIPPQLTVVGDQAFFRADDGVHGRELWKTDGTFAGTALVKDVHPGPDGSLPDALTAGPDGELYFAATDGEHGVELWRSDGTEPGTVMVEDLQPGPAPSNPEQLTAAEGTLFFTADDGIHGRELWALPLPLPPH